MEEDLPQLALETELEVEELVAITMLLVFLYRLELMLHQSVLVDRQTIMGERLHLTQ